jgi:hypothetical protein
MDFSDNLVADEDKFTRDSRTELNYFFAESFKVFSANKWYHEQLLQATQNKEDLNGEVLRQAALQQQQEVDVDEVTFKNKLKKNFKIKFDCDHLRYFASTGKEVDDKNKVYIYILTNRKRLNNMHSCMEIEVVSFDRCEAISESPERALEILHKR